MAEILNKYHLKVRVVESGITNRLYEFDREYDPNQAIFLQVTGPTGQGFEFELESPKGYSLSEIAFQNSVTSGPNAEDLSEEPIWFVLGRNGEALFCQPNIVNIHSITFQQVEDVATRYFPDSSPRHLTLTYMVIPAYGGLGACRMEIATELAGTLFRWIRIAVTFLRSYVLQISDFGLMRSKGSKRDLERRDLDRRGWREMGRVERLVGLARTRTLRELDEMLCVPRWETWMLLFQLGYARKFMKRGWHPSESKWARNNRLKWASNREKYLDWYHLNI